MTYKKLVMAIAAGAFLVVGLLVVRPTSATPGNGVTPVVIASGELQEIVRAKFKDSDGGFGDGFDVSSVQVVKFTVVPGGYFGWHQHGGPVWATIVAGELTFYDSDDPTCTPTVYSAGQTFFETGQHTHTARNNGSVEVVVYGTFMLPEGAAVRVDAPDPGVCPF
jgi:quercetin dioxygenase-like cupin family protein